MVHGCDPNAWHRGSDGVQLTLLHRAILLHDTATACFLVRNGADVNSSTRPGTSGGGFYPPLHLACERGLVEVAQSLLENHANVNATVKTCILLHVDDIVWWNPFRQGSAATSVNTCIQYMYTRVHVHALYMYL